MPNIKHAMLPCLYKEYKKKENRRIHPEILGTLLDTMRCPSLRAASFPFPFRHRSCLAFVSTAPDICPELRCCQTAIC